MGRTASRRLAGAAAIIGIVLMVAAGFLLYLSTGVNGAGQAPNPLVFSPPPSPPATILPISPTLPTKSVMDTVPPAAPSRLEIPSIGANAEVGKIALTHDAAGNAQLVPPEQTYDDLMRAYWWSERQTPGYPVSGTTFLIGHTCHAVNCPAVFNMLQTIQPGALIRVSTPNGELTYQVFDTHTYPSQDIAYAAKVYKNVPNQLVLATCKLRSDGKAQTDRFVVWAKLVQSVVQ